MVGGWGRLRQLFQRTWQWNVWKSSGSAQAGRLHRILGLAPSTSTSPPAHCSWHASRIYPVHRLLQSQPTSPLLSQRALYSDDLHKGLLIRRWKTEDNGEEDKKLGLVARFKKLWKQYWYIVLPVHLVTSLGWFGGFYMLSAR